MLYILIAVALGFGVSLFFNWRQNMQKGVLECDLENKNSRKLREVTKSLADVQEALAVVIQLSSPEEEKEPLVDLLAGEGEGD